MIRALVGLGANLGPRRQTLEAAVTALGDLPTTRVLARSPWITSAAEGSPPGAPDFLNGACLLATSLSPRELLTGLLTIEALHGRTRSVPGAPRTLDLDLLFYGDRIVEEADLTVPHPRAHLRAFVMEPAARLWPEHVHPRLGRSLARLRDDLLPRDARAATHSAD